MKLNRGTMVLSLDLELCWERFDQLPVPFIEADSSEERTQIKRLLSLLHRHEIPANWAVVGHLMQDRCARNGSNAHADVLPHPNAPGFAKTCTPTIPAPAQFGHPVGTHPTLWNGSERLTWGTRSPHTPSCTSTTGIRNTATPSRGPSSQCQWRRRRKTSR